MANSPWINLQGHDVKTRRRRTGALGPGTQGSPGTQRDVEVLGGSQRNHGKMSEDYRKTMGKYGKIHDSCFFMRKCWRNVGKREEHAFGGGKTMREL